MNKHEENIFTSYPINRLQPLFSKNGPLDKDWIRNEEDNKPEPPKDPFLNLVNNTAWIGPDGFTGSTIIWIESNTTWVVEN